MFKQPQRLEILEEQQKKKFLSDNVHQVRNWSLKKKDTAKISIQFNLISMNTNIYLYLY